MRPIEAVYERRLATTLAGLPRPQHVGIMLDGNRRWARQAGHTDVREGYRAGGAKTTEFLGWCAADGIERVTLFMLSDDNLGRPAEQLGPLIEIIEETVRDITAAGRSWEVQVIGSLDMLPGASARVLKEAAASTTGRGGLKVDVAVGYGGRREIVDAVKSAFEEHIAMRRRPCRTGRAVRDRGHLPASVLADGRPHRLHHPDLRRAAAVRLPSLAVRVRRDALGGLLLVSVPPRGLPARTSLVRES